MILGSLLFLSQSRGRTLAWEYFRSRIITDDDICNAEVETGSCLSSYIVFAIITVLGIVLFCFSAKKYRIRVRGTSLKYYL